MKKIFYLIFILFLFISNYSCNKNAFIVNTESSKIENLINGKLYNELNEVITTKKLISKWESELNEEGFDVKLSNFKIIESYNEQNDSKVYFIKSKSSDNTIETGAFINISQDGKAILGKKKCTCTGCPNGCELRIIGTSCSCTDCWPSETNSKCTKTETIQSPNFGLE